MLVLCGPSSEVGGKGGRVTLREDIEGIRVLGLWHWLYRRFFYRSLMRVAHRWHWHHAPPIYPEGDVQLWCKWCGFRQTIRRTADKVDA